MEFSVLMSVYCKEDPSAFDKALYSNLTLQTLKPTQLVLVCDGPLTDGLNTVVDKYCSLYPKTITVCRLEKNQGLGKALNYGLSQCNHDLILRSDSDDICVSERLALQTKFMADHPEISACSGTIDEFEENPDVPNKVKRMPESDDEIRIYAQKRNPLNHMATAFRKKDVLSVGSYIHLQYLEDYYLWVRLLAAGNKLANMKETLVHARVGNGMVERRGDKRYIQSWRTLGEFMLKEGLITRKCHAMNLLKLRIWCAVPNSVRALIYNKILRR